MRQACRRCKSTNTKVLSPTRMFCKNCKNTWGFIARRPAPRKRSSK